MLEQLRTSWPCPREHCPEHCSDIKAVGGNITRNPLSVQHRNFFIMKPGFTEKRAINRYQEHKYGYVACTKIDPVLRNAQSSL